MCGQQWNVLRVTFAKCLGKRDISPKHRRPWVYLIIENVTILQIYWSARLRNGENLRVPGGLLVGNDQRQFVRHASSICLATFLACLPTVLLRCCADHSRTSSLYGIIKATESHISCMCTRRQVVLAGHDGCYWLMQRGVRSFDAPTRRPQTRRHCGTFSGYGSLSCRLH